MLFLENHLVAYLVIHGEEEIESSICYPELAAFPKLVQGVSNITLPKAIEKIV